MRDSVIIYRSFYEALQGVNEKSYKKIMNATLKYAMDEIEPVGLSGLEQTVFLLAKPQIDSNNRKYLAGKKGAEFGASGGRPKKVESYEKIMQEFCVEEIVKPTLWEFIKHCQLNKKTLTNDKLEGIIIELDKTCEDEETKVAMLQNAINGGYFDVKRGAI